MGEKLWVSLKKKCTGYFWSLLKTTRNFTKKILYPIFGKIGPICVVGQGLLQDYR